MSEPKHISEFFDDAMKGIMKYPHTPFEFGHHARLSGKPIHDNPYVRDTGQWHEWRRGWELAKLEHGRKG